MARTKKLAVIIREGEAVSPYGFEIFGGGARSVAEVYAFHLDAGEKRGRFEADKIRSAIDFYKERGWLGKPFAYTKWDDGEDWDVRAHGSRIMRLVNGRQVDDPEGERQSVVAGMKRDASFLIERGLIEEGPDGADRVAMTPKGMDLARRIAQKASAGDARAAAAELGVHPSYLLVSLAAEHAAAVKSKAMATANSEIRESDYDGYVEYLEDAANAILMNGDLD